MFVATRQDANALGLRCACAKGQKSGRAGALVEQHLGVGEAIERKSASLIGSWLARL